MYSNKFNQKLEIKLILSFIHNLSWLERHSILQTLTINIKMEFNTVQNVCCRVLHCVRDEKWIYNGQSQKNSHIVLLFYIANANAWSNYLSDLTATWYV